MNNSNKAFRLFEYNKIFYEDIHLSYKGPIDEKMLSVIGDYIDVIFAEDPIASKKVFKIFIELAQNVSFYSAEFNLLHPKKEMEIGIGTVIIASDEQHYIFVTGNRVKNEDIVPVIEKCEIINSLDRESLREYKRQQRKLPVSSKGGGNIGLIQVALTSANPLDFEVTPLDDDFSFFSIAAKVKRQTNKK